MRLTDLPLTLIASINKRNSMRFSFIDNNEWIANNSLILARAYYYFNYNFPKMNRKKTDEEKKNISRKEKENMQQKTHQVNRNENVNEINFRALAPGLDVYISIRLLFLNINIIYSCLLIKCMVLFSSRGSFD